MGCAQSNTYYFGFINVAISHIDLFSFVIGVALTVGLFYLVGCVRHQRQANRHILNNAKIRRLQGWDLNNRTQEWNGYPMVLQPKVPHSLTPAVPDTSTMPSAPFQHQSIAIPWPTQQWASHGRPHCYTDQIKKPPTLQYQDWAFFSPHKSFHFILNLQELDWFWILTVDHPGISSEIGLF